MMFLKVLSLTKHTPPHTPTNTPSIHRQWCDNYLAYFFGGRVWHLSDNKSKSKRQINYTFSPPITKFICLFAELFFLCRFDLTGKTRGKIGKTIRTTSSYVLLFLQIFLRRICVCLLFFFCTPNVLTFYALFSLPVCVCVCVSVVDWWKWKFCSFSMPLHEPKRCSLLR